MNTPTGRVTTLFAKAGEIYRKWTVFCLGFLTGWLSFFVFVVTLYYATQATMALLSWLGGM